MSPLRSKPAFGVSDGWEFSVPQNPFICFISLVSRIMGRSKGAASGTSQSTNGETEAGPGAGPTRQLAGPPQTSHILTPQANALSMIPHIPHTEGREGGTVLWNNRIRILTKRLTSSTLEMGKTPLGSGNLSVLWSPQGTDRLAPAGANFGAASMGRLLSQNRQISPD